MNKEEQWLAYVDLEVRSAFCIVCGQYELPFHLMLGLANYLYYTYSETPLKRHHWDQLFFPRGMEVSKLHVQN